MLLAPQTTVFANVGDSFETPTVGEISQRPNDLGMGGFNVELEAQTSRTFELGARHSVAKPGFGLQHLEASASSYAIFLRGELVRFEDETGQSFFRNAGRSRRLGAELELDASAFDHLTIRLAVTSISAQFIGDQGAGTERSGNKVPGIAPHRVGANVSWKAPSGPFGSIDYDYTRRTFANDENTENAPSQHLVGLRVGMRGQVGRTAMHYEGYLAITNATGTANVDNLRTNANAGRYYEPGWPRHAVLGIKFGWDFGDKPADDPGDDPSIDHRTSSVARWPRG